MNVYECNGKKFHEMEYGIYHFTAMERFPLHAQQNSNFYSISVIIISQLNEQNLVRCDIFNKYKTFFVLIYSYINTSGNWENEKLCGNTTPEGRSVFTQRNIKKEIFRRFRVDIELYQHGS